MRTGQQDEKWENQLWQMFQREGGRNQREIFLDTSVLYVHFTLIPTSVTFKAVEPSLMAPCNPALISPHVVPQTMP